MEISVWINLIYRVLIRNHLLQYWRVPGWQAKTENLLYWFVKLKWDWIYLKKLLLDRYLDIYISRKIGLCMSWFGRPISNQPTGQSYHFFDLKIQIYYSHFSSIFLQELSNPVLFGHYQCYFKKVEIFDSHFCVKLQFKYFNSLE